MPFRVRETATPSRCIVESTGPVAPGLYLAKDELTDPNTVLRLLNLFLNHRQPDDPQPSEIMANLFPDLWDRMEPILLELAKKELARAAGQAVGAEDDDDD
jgi:hypothetical protein